ncbi:MAG: YeeE/YedE family protein [Planctomycetes bacterium]|nr:YeeE/YedE family protein [Planctomycetota bacterium]
MQRQATPFWNPYLSGIGLGLVLVLSYVVLGAGLGASGAIARTSAVLADRVAPAAVRHNAYFSPWFAEGSPLAHYLVFMAVGVLLGGFGSALNAGRVAPGIERGAGASAFVRLGYALGGGALAGFASRMAQGCTSGQALSGGALLLSGSWAFMFAVFAGAFGAAWFVRKEWQA